MLPIYGVARFLQEKYQLSLEILDFSAESPMHLQIEKREPKSSQPRRSLLVVTTMSGRPGPATMQMNVEWEEQGQPPQGNNFVLHF
jgi:hypothetical protein